MNICCVGYKLAAEFCLPTLAIEYIQELCLACMQHFPSACLSVCRSTWSTWSAIGSGQPLFASRVGRLSEGRLGSYIGTDGTREAQTILSSTICIIFITLLLHYGDLHR